MAFGAAKASGSLRSTASDGPIMAIPRLRKQGLYDPQFEHDACGVGVVANLSGEKTHRIIDQGIEILCNLEHRGARGADPLTGDGAGLLLQTPDDLLRAEAARLGFALPPPGAYGVGMVFLPAAEGPRAACRAIIEQSVADLGARLLGWRAVPVAPETIGVHARRVMPHIAQFFVGGGRTRRTGTPWRADSI